MVGSQDSQPVGEQLLEGRGRAGRASGNIPGRSQDLLQSVADDPVFDLSGQPSQSMGLVGVMNVVQRTHAGGDLRNFHRSHGAAGLALRSYLRGAGLTGGEVLSGPLVGGRG